MVKQAKQQLMTLGLHCWTRVSQ